MRKSFSVRILLFGVTFLMLMCAIALQYHRKQQFLNWYNGPKLVTAIVTSGTGWFNSSQFIEGVAQEFEIGCDFYQGSYYRDFTYNDCVSELNCLSRSNTRNSELTEQQIDRLTRKLIAMMRLNGERGHQLVYQFTLDSGELWLYQLWDTYEVFFGIETIQVFLMSTKNHELELLDISNSRRVEPNEYVTWRIGTYYVTHDPDFAEKRAILLIHAWSQNSTNDVLASERIQHGECVIHYHRTQSSSVQERTVLNSDLNK